MRHIHRTDTARHEADLEAKEQIWKTGMKLFDYVAELRAVVGRHVSHFPHGALTCEQVDKLLSALENLEEARGILRDLSAELPIKEGGRIERN